MMQICEYCEIVFTCIRCPLCEETEALNVALKERDELREKVDSLASDRDKLLEEVEGLSQELDQEFLTSDQRKKARAERTVERQSTYPPVGRRHII